MNEKLRAYVEELFKNAPKTKQTVEIKEEILQNTIDRYNDLIKEGRSPEAAYNISVAGIGDEPRYKGKTFAYCGGKRCCLGAYPCSLLYSKLFDGCVGSGNCA
ncbi:MAG: permease prefix domain 1-containing protein [Acutalibacteraceae bacterium]